MLLFWSLVFLLVALVAAVFGFGGIAAGAACPTSGARAAAISTCR